MTTLTIREIILLILIVLGVIGVVWYNHHERQIGGLEMQKAVDAASQKVKDDAILETEALQKRADTADKEAKDAHDKLNKFIADDPLLPVRVCHASIGSSSGRLSEGGTPKTVTSATGTGSTVVPGLPKTAVGPDIGPGLTILVQAAAELAIDEKEFQKR